MQLSVKLEPIEARVFGVLVEKSMTTPEQYPLTVNGTTQGANQKTNRDPVLSLDEDEVAIALQHLEKKYMARSVFLANSRVEKYVHNGKDALGLQSAELAVLAELMLRGPQTPGDLRARAGRMTAIESLDQLQAILARLIERELVRRLDPGPGSRAERYVQLLCPDLHSIDAAAPAEPTRGGLASRVDALEGEVTRLRQQLQAMAQRLGVTLD